MITIIILVSTLILYSVASFIMYKNRASSVVLVDFDSVLVNIEHIIKRGQIYVKNNPDKSINDYVGAHITEQEVNPVGMQSALSLQNKDYKLVFVSIRHESLRRETALILNEWGLVGELYMNTDSQRGWQLKCELVQKLLAKKQRVVGILDKSDDRAVIKKCYPRIKEF